MYIFTYFVTFVSVQVQMKNILFITISFQASQIPRNSFIPMLLSTRNKTVNSMFNRETLETVDGQRCSEARSLLQTVSPLINLGLFALPPITHLHEHVEKQFLVFILFALTKWLVGTQLLLFAIIILSANFNHLSFVIGDQRVFAIHCIYEREFKIYIVQILKAFYLYTNNKTCFTYTH